MSDITGVGLFAPARWTHRFARWWRGPTDPRAGHDLGYLSAALLATASMLLLLRALLGTPGGWGIDHLPGWVDASADGPIRTTVDAVWGSGRTAIAWIYLSIDSVFFVPVYAAVLVQSAALLANGLADDLPERFPRAERVLFMAMAVPVLALMGVDLLENAIGLARLGPVGGVLAVVCTLVAGLALWRVAPLRWAGGRVPVTCALVLGVTVAGLGSAGSTCAVGRPMVGLEALWRAGCGAHQAKGLLALVAVALVLVALMAWLFGVRLTPESGSERRLARARLRSAILNIVVRSRYVLVALALAAALTVTMDQGRDVLYAIASFPFRTDVGPGGERWALAAGSGLVVLATGGAVWLLMFTCWFWTRGVVQIRAADTPGDAPGDAAVQAFAQHWARVLALVPVLLVVVLCAGVEQDAVVSATAATRAWMGPVLVVWAFGLAAIVFGVWFLMGRAQAPEAHGHYHDCLDWRQWGARAGFWAGDAPRDKYRFGGVVRAARLPLLLAAGMLLCRAVDAVPAAWVPWGRDVVPTMGLAVLMFEIALWLCFFGWLSIFEVHRSVPWVGLLVAAGGVLGASGCTVNHRVWAQLPSTDPDPSGALRMLAFTFGLVVVLMWSYRWVMALAARRAARQGAPWRAIELLAGAALVMALGGVLAAADRWAPPPQPGMTAAASSAPAPVRPGLDEALGRWLMQLCNASADDPAGCRPAVPPDADGSLRLLLVSSEGGGIRAAAWTALVLDQLAEADPHFLARTFSLSGVSGGAVGMAAFRACSVRPDDGHSRRECLRRFARTDMLAPLMSAWMFEDVLARVVPTSACAHPGCGILSRGTWFEGAMASGATSLRLGVLASRGQAGEPHVPYLFLNATWVETGERAIASDLRVEWPTFPGARDQLDVLGGDLPLAAAAHNAARFPFINAIGAMVTTRGRCADRRGGTLAAPGPAAPLPDADRQEVCGHLADGGYFDNSAGHTTLDVLAGLARCLSDSAARPGACGPLAPAQRQWLRAHVVPQVLMVRNGVLAPAELGEECLDQAPAMSPRRVDLMPAAPGGCSVPGTALPQPGRPVCRARASLFVDVAGPALALLNAGGAGGHARLAQARQAEALRALRSMMGGAAAQSTLPPVQVFDLVADGVRYPLGWHLSGLAVERMDARAATCRALPAAP